MYIYDYILYAFCILFPGKKPRGSALGAVSCSAPSTQRFGGGLETRVMSSRGPTNIHKP